jgi:transmembrane sensor
VKGRERRERAAQEAAEWLLSLNGSEMTRSERLEFIAWLRESPIHVAEMLHVAGAHKRLAEFSDWAHIPPADLADLAATIRALPMTRSPAMPPGLLRIPCLAGASQTRPWRLRTRWGALPACVIALAALLYWNTNHSNVEVGDSDGSKLVTLQDGSRVRLARRARLEVHFAAHERQVVLAEGDALFSITKDAARPFIVQTGQTRVRAVGTVFGIEREEASVTVTVQEGRVAVTNVPETPLPVPGTSVPRFLPELTEISLGANQQVTVPAVGAVGVVHKVDSQRELAWADGRLVFDNESVAQVVRRFNHFNRVQLKVSAPELASRSVTAVFDANDPQAFIVFLESVTDVRITHPAPNEILIAPEGPR